MKNRFVSLLMIMLVLVLSFSFVGCNKTLNDDINALLESSTLKKIYCEATLLDDFSDDEILLVMFPEYNFVEYTANDFKCIGCIEVEDLTIAPTEGKLCKILYLKLDTHSKENVLNAIRLLELRRDVYCAEPNYLMSIE